MTEGDARETEMLKIRLDYAWKHFESAARQRMLFLNYFLIATGILASAFGFSIKEGLYPVSVFVCVFGFVTSLAFFFFDIRMLQFVNRSLKVLADLERREVFPDGYQDRAGRQLGLARLEPDGEKAAAKVKWWIRGIEILAALGFASGTWLAITSWYSSPPSHREKRINQQPTTIEARAGNSSSSAPAGVTTEPTRQGAPRHH